MLPNVLKAAERLFTLQDKADSLTMNPQPDNSRSAPHNSALTFDSISYSYGENIALKDISFTLAPEQKVAIVGRSGSGKTTLVNLLTGLWPLQQGKITLNDDTTAVNLHSLSSDARANIINILAQQHHIFDATLRENLRYATPDASETQMLEALTQAQLKPWVDDLQKGLDTRLGTAGRKVSQGQSRRIAIAQALLKQASILVLDEPTEGLDNRSKENVMRAILTVMNKATVLTVTHDPELLAQMDKIIWLENGQLVAQGTHNELTHTYNSYKALTTRF